MPSYPLARDGVFWTLQGEGALVGMPMVFVRLGGCDVACPFCDTDYQPVERVSVDELLTRIRAFGLPRVWITGGEPTIHDLHPLVTALRADAFWVALATAGERRAIPAVDWLSCSPHRPGRLAIAKAEELKLVPDLFPAQFAALVEESERGAFGLRYVQPLDGASGSLTRCVEFVREHPTWRVSTQMHKQWGIA